MSIIDQIDFSLEKASSLQQRRMEAEESKQRSLNYDIDQLRSQLEQSDEYSREDMTPEKSGDNSQYSPLRNEIRQLEMQNQLLQSTDRINQQENEYSDNENQEQIQPKYEKKQSKKPQPKLRENKQVPQKQAKQQQQPKQVKQQRSVPKSTQIITTIERRNEKENTYTLQEDRQDYRKLQQHIQSVKEKVATQLRQNQTKTQPIPQPQEDQQYKIRGYRDQAEIKYFGRPLPCNECVFLLNKGQSSDFCSQHGKLNKERPANKAVPKRLAKYF